MSLFDSFFLAGFESACHINKYGTRLNMLQLTQHDRLVSSDYAMLGDLFIGETSHFGVGRGAWLREVVAEVRLAIQNGVPMEGITLYSIIDRPDWDETEAWHNSGLWDLAADETGVLRWVLNEEYALVLREALQGDWLPVS